MKKYFITVLLLSITVYSQSLYRNVMISDVDEPNEVTIIVNPYDNNHLIAAANLDGLYYSFDGGQNWIIRKLNSEEYGVWGDPCLVFDAKGDLYYFHLASNSKYWYDRIVCQKSYDGGISWNKGTYLGHNSPHLQDKEWACCDLTYSPYRNNLYAVWTQCGQDEIEANNPSSNPGENFGSNIFFSRSTDGGNNWSTMKKISGIPGTPCTNVDSTVLGVVNCIGANGQVYVCWASPNGIFFDKSTDAGISWLENDVKAAELPAGFKCNIPGIYRAFGFPSIASDNSFGRYGNTIYISWSDQSNGSNNTDVWITKSTDGGASWSQKKLVNDDGTVSHQFFSWMTIDHSNGNIYVVFYDRRYYDDNKTDVFMAKSTDGGENFTNEIISQLPFEPDQSVFFGDYINIIANNGMIRPVWTRLEGTELSIWTALINEYE